MLKGDPKEQVNVATYPFAAELMRRLRTSLALMVGKNLRGR